MDRRVKERLIGATILVVLIVLLVPEFLSGPHSAAAPPAHGPAAFTQTYVVDVDHIGSAPPQAAQASVAASVAAPAPAIEPAPAAAPMPPAAPAPAMSKPVAVALVPAAGAGWTLQLGSFANKTNAESLTRQLKSEGFNAYIAPIGTAAAQRFRVRLGPIADRATAAGIMAKLQAHRHASTLLPPAE
jgi:DedD protein